MEEAGVQGLKRAIALSGDAVRKRKRCDMMKQSKPETLCEGVILKKLLMGNEAFAHAALEAGVGVVAGYPGTPSSELIETVAKLHAAGAAHGVHVEWSTNEKAALELLEGASIAGARVLFTCKQMGLNVASDALMSLNYIGVNGGFVLFVADDPGPISSQTEQDTRRFAAFAKVPVLDPATPEQGFAMMQEAFELSERYGTPVIVRPTTRVNHASAFFEVAAETHARAPRGGGFERDPRWVIFPRRSFAAHGEINERLALIARDEQLAPFNVIEEYRGTNENVGSPARIGIIAGGVSATYTREALRMLDAADAGAGAPSATDVSAASASAQDATGALGASAQGATGATSTMLAPYRFLQVGLPYPFPTETVKQFAAGLERIIVLEELDSTLEESLLALAGRTHASFDVLGKLTGHVPARGELSVDIALDVLTPLLCTTDDTASNQTSAPEAATSSTLQNLPVRPPVLCPGCPHRGSFYAVKKALGKTPGVYCGDIGCYTLGNAMPLDAVDTCLCMGAGITMAQGFSVVEPERKALAFVGDSTFFASGITGLANAIYNEHDITVCVLDNSTTAMTGSQPHPGTGVTLMGSRHEGISIRAMLEALGFTCIEEANPLEFAEAREAAKRAINFEGPSAIIFRSPCIQLIKPSEPAAVDTATCTGCKRCITEIGCPALGFNAEARGAKSGERGQAFVDAALCNGCMLCTQVCPTKSIAGACAYKVDTNNAQAEALAATQTEATTAQADASAAQTPTAQGNMPTAQGNTPTAQAAPEKEASHA